MKFCMAVGNGMVTYRYGRYKLQGSSCQVYSFCNGFNSWLGSVKYVINSNKKSLVSVSHNLIVCTPRVDHCVGLSHHLIT